MLFFQGVLLGGYAYVLAGVRLLGVRRQAALHVALLLLAALFVPATLSAFATQPSIASDNPTFHLLWFLLKTIGLPFFVLSATAPLLQKWFAAIPHPSARDPYFLYAASNAGSLLALLSFPLLLEPNLRVSEQGRMWRRSTPCWACWSRRAQLRCGVTEKRLPKKSQFRRVTPKGKTLSRARLTKTRPLRRCAAFAGQCWPLSLRVLCWE